VTNILAANVPLTNGLAIVTTNLTADTNNFGNHLITAKYSGDGTFPPANATRAQKVHAHATSTSIASAQIGATNTVVFTATVTSIPTGGGMPTGMITFQDNSTVIAQIPLVSGIARYTNSNFAAGAHAISATYASDTMFAASAGQIVPTAPILAAAIVPGTGTFLLTFSNSIGAPLTVLVSSDLTTALSNWTVAGQAIENMPGRFQFSDAVAQNQSQRFYRVRSP
jgi:hypothetical protein